MKKPLVLCIMDGFGDNPSDFGNAIVAANTPNLDNLMKQYPHTDIGASGMDVGLPDGQMGNSEVGHTNIGAGRVVYQELTRITKSIADGDFYQNEVLVAAIQHAIDNGTALHLMGLLSDGGVHSHNTHAWALVELAKRMGLKKVFLHCILDGRDVPPSSGKAFVAEAQQKLTDFGVGKIATVMGRFYAMDRDNIWERVALAYKAMVLGQGAQNSDPVATVAASYDAIDEDGKFITDEFVLPTVCAQDGRISANDSVVFFNFRPDRARELTRSFVDPAFDGFARAGGMLPLHFVCMTQYDEKMPNVKVAFTPQSLANTLGEYLSANGKTQLRIAETQKYAHVTFFFNGGEEKVYDQEDRILVPSPKISTFDLMPQMSAPEVSEKVNEAVLSGKYDVIILNFANCDMVGHTGIFAAAVEAVEMVDTCVGTLYNAVMQMDGQLLITADHGNADKMCEPDGSPFTAHTTFPVPFIVVNYPCTLRAGGRLCDIAPTMLKMLGLSQPVEMTGTSIVE